MPYGSSPLINTCFGVTPPDTQASGLAGYRRARVGDFRGWLVVSST